MIGASKYFVAVLNKTATHDEPDVREVGNSWEFFLAKTYAGAVAKAEELVKKFPNDAIRLGKFMEEFSVAPVPTVTRKEINQGPFSLDSFYRPPTPFDFTNSPITPLVLPTPSPKNYYRTYDGRKRYL